jgi:hypothetical protein
MAHHRTPGLRLPGSRPTNFHPANLIVAKVQN